MTEITYVQIHIPLIGNIKIQSAAEYGKVNHLLGYIEAVRQYRHDYVEIMDAIENKARDMGILVE